MFTRTVGTWHGLFDVVRWTGLGTPVLADFPPELHAPIRRYYETSEACAVARCELTVAKAHTKIDCERIDRALAGL